MASTHCTTSQIQHTAPSGSPLAILGDKTCRSDGTRRCASASRRSVRDRKRIEAEATRARNRYIAETSRRRNAANSTAYRRGAGTVRSGARAYDTMPVPAETGTAAQLETVAIHAADGTISLYDIYVIEEGRRTWIGSRRTPAQCQDAFEAHCGLKPRGK